MLNLFIIHLIGLMSPGPDFLYVVRTAIRDSRSRAIASVFGITLGVGFWAISAILGLSLLFTTYPFLQGIIMLLGGSYLLYIGFHMLASRHNIRFEDAYQSENTTIGKAVLKGLFVNLSNAKVVIYFSSVMSFVLVDITETGVIFGALSIIVIETFLYFYLISFLFSRGMVKQFYSNYSRYLDNIAGIIFLGFALYLIYSSIQLELKI
ncbi:RhtB (resistance to homoserine/threonine) family protein [Bisgaardia hudsonensis]|uniref:RhtB (Resistance to homoserine/threonine) family protein n=1 Tax=Bisgaardia hudsonensis TaxID=109472 RepID=A0A4R2N379_9PAST|nr:LysE family transporter [Bisgaardia hudsonensis]QLB12815.1 hypothetical protein A6A11_03940 [Bisgaardia hudsonensis]TCP14373.1 RhtB (resistance to homoserine/threonine) family protein [Bisgaardia hudsonensis]